MLQRLSEQVRECLRRAAEAKAQADTVSDPELKKSYSELEGNWLFLARSYMLSESVQDFVGRQRKKKEREPVDPRLPVVGQLFDLLPLAIYIGDASVQNREIVVERADGSHVVALASIHPFKDRMGNVLGAVNCFQDITRRKRRERQIAALAGEADRPTKNILAILHGSKDTIEARIGALDKVHALFVQSGGAGAKLSSIARQELAACFSAGGLRARIGGPDLLLAPHTAQSVALILHELRTNAAKYGSLSVSEGQIEVKWLHARDGQLILNWMESGGPPAHQPKRESLGASIVDRLVGELKGEIRRDWRAQGFACQIVLQL